jgi:hypothetical protein
VTVRAKDPSFATDNAPDAFSELVEAGRRHGHKAETGEPVAPRRPISEQVANRILAMIKSGNLTSGDRLPTIRKYASYAEGNGLIRKLA